MSQSRRFCVVALGGLALMLAMASSAHALTSQGQQMMRNWAQADRCAASAQKQFPDYTPESLAKRDQALQQCLANSVLAPRAPQAPDAPPRP